MLYKYIIDVGKDDKNIPILIYAKCRRRFLLAAATGYRILKLSESKLGLCLN